MSDAPEMIVVKIRKKNKGLKKKLQKLADDSTSPSLNNFIETHLVKIANKK
jgi:hypothetical protein